MFGRHGHGGGGPHGFHAMWSYRSRDGAQRSHAERGGRRRMFDGKELRLVLLKLIEEQSRHGYDLIRDIEERTGGAYAPSPGVVYPTLTLLADMGMISEAPSEGSRKLFAIAEWGTAVLADKAEEVAALFARLAELGAARAHTDGAPIRRAMGNLRTVLQNRLSAEGVTAETQHDVAALLDEAARKIERM